MSIYDYLELIGEKFEMDLFNNNDISDEVYEVLLEDLKQDLENILEKMKYYKDIANK